MLFDNMVFTVNTELCQDFIENAIKVKPSDFLVQRSLIAKHIGFDFSFLVADQMGNAH
eukprot:c24531_g3_i1 orf=2-172(-)